MDWYSIFPGILNMSLTGSVVILFVLLARFFMKEMPKIYSYVLWTVVLFRLLCPVSISSDFSLLGMLKVSAVSAGGMTSSVEYVPSDIVHTENPKVSIPISGVEEYLNANLPQGREQLAADPLETPMSLLTYLWMTGCAVMLGYGILSYFKLCGRLVGAIHVRDNIYMADHISSPFVMGIIRPRIYLLSSLGENEEEYIILHEQQHIQRLDHIVKAVAYLALCIHWFNPLVWIAFVLSAKDMEMSCDEAVIKKMGESIRADYSASLLCLSANQRMVFAAPLTFGEGDTKGRIKNLARWKKPAVWTSIGAAVVCVILIWMGASNPEEILSHSLMDATVVETYEKTVPHTDVYKAWVRNTYYKMSDGTWKVDITNETEETIESHTYKYRIVLHGRMPNAAVDSNYILLSNIPDITFRQAWMASGFSSHMDDYFTLEEAVFVESWLGDLEANHPKRDENTIYVLSETETDHE